MDNLSFNAKFAKMQETEKEIPMNYYDQHIHTDFSFDSTANMEDYLAHAQGCFVSTEHVDLKNPANNFHDSIMDYDAYSSHIEELSKHTTIELRKGVEIGYCSAHHDRLVNWLSDKEFDIVLLSFHQNGIFDYMDEEAKEHDPKEVLHMYFQQMLDGVKAFPYANVLTHFDYVSRIQDISDEMFLNIATPYLKQIFPLMIEKRIALELNTRSMFHYGQLSLYETVVDLYKDMGGTMFTMSSDAHTAAAYAYAFDKGRLFLQRHGIKELQVFEKQIPQGITIS